MDRNGEENEPVDRPLILVTNDDGVWAEGLWAAAEAVLPLGEVLVAAPDRQWSGAGRSMPYDVTGRVDSFRLELHGQKVMAHAVDGSPALAVEHGLLELASRPPALVVSGINFGANMGSEVTISGTVGAALEAAAFGIPALAVSLEMDPVYHLTGDGTADYTAAKAFTHDFARRLLTGALPSDVHVLSINVPRDAPTATAWRVIHLSRFRYFWPIAPDRSNGSARPGYRLLADSRQCEPGSDIYAVNVDRVVSVTPLSLDLTSRVGLETLESGLRDESASGSGEPWTWRVPFEAWEMGCCGELRPSWLAEGRLK
jgi:5'-nucleotidase